ncbi:DUF427 domain-containing protein [Roseibium denhamense]|nr:DUF427 domain-containing protein [Roseibium denhamense]MTI05033.1 DUF427 domain-containing protein [Roseibium denhamense]
MTALEKVFENAIRNPGDPGHLMVIKPVKRRVRIYTGDVLIADTTAALRVMEIGRSVYDPVIYVPEQDVLVALGNIEKSTHCPIKGDASYVSLGTVEIGWTYKNPIPTSEILAGHLAFWPDKVRLVEGA